MFGRQVHVGSRACGQRNLLFVCVCVLFRLQTCFTLQLKRGLFWYGHHPKMHEVVSDRSSRAEWTDLRKIAMHIFLNSNNVEQKNRW